MRPTSAWFRIIKRHQEKEINKNYHSMKLMKVNTKFFNKILTNQIQKYMRKIIHYHQEVFISEMQGWFSIYK